MKFVLFIHRATIVSGLPKYQAGQCNVLWRRNERLLAPDVSISRLACDAAQHRLTPDASRIRRNVA